MLIKFRLACSDYICVFIHKDSFMRSLTAIYSCLGISILKSPSVTHCLNFNLFDTRLRLLIQVYSKNESDLCVFILHSLSYGLYMSFKEIISINYFLVVSLWFQIIIKCPDSERIEIPHMIENLKCWGLHLEFLMF